MTMTALTSIVLLILAFVGGGWGYNQWGAGGGVGPFGIVLVVLLCLYFTGIF